jgi:ubiquinol-cytochrome c reductase iron-sulfur subunit
VRPTRDLLRGLAVLMALRWLTRLVPSRRPRRSDDEERPPGSPGEQRAVGLALMLSMSGSGGFALAYVLDAGPQAQGAALAVALLSLAVALGVWSQRLVPHRVVEEEREPMSASRPAEEALARDLHAPLARRGFLVRMLGVALGSLGVAAAFPIVSLGPAAGDAVRRTGWRRGARLVTPEGAPVRLGTLPVGGTLSVFPEGRTDEVEAQVVLIRLDPDDLRAQPAGDRSTVAGHVAFSQICTHAGCPVGLYEQRSRRLLCPCHQSLFDVRDGARPVGGPAIRALPQLPIGVDEEGFIVARAGLLGHAGPDTWATLS